MGFDFQPRYEAAGELWVKFSEHNKWLKSGEEAVSSSVPKVVLGAAK